MLRPLSELKSDIVEGHFERGGKTIHGVARPTNSSLKTLMSTDESIIGTVYYDTEDLQ